MNNILVTGASGFVGKALCAELERRQRGYLPVYRRGAAAPAQGFLVDEISATTDWGAALRGVGVAVHLAARVHVMDDRSSDPLAAFRALNVDASVNLARQCAAAGVRRFVYVSSVKVNGERTDGKGFSAFDRPAPGDPYGQSKLEAELALAQVAGASGMELVIVRPPLVYGPGVRANFHKLMGLVKRGLPLPLGAVRNKRSMVALPNLVDLLLLCCDHPAAAGQVFMVSDDDDMSVADLLRKLAGAMHKRALLLPVPTGLIAAGAALVGQSAAASRLLDSLQVDIEHTKSTLGWTPPVDVQTALRDTVLHFLTHS